MQDADYRCIPLRRRDGSLKGEAHVDPADHDDLAQWKWHLGSNGYAIRLERVEPNVYRAVPMHRYLMGLGYGDKREVAARRPASEASTGSRRVTAGRHVGARRSS